MMLPEPALTLTLPSLHDGLVLDCRIYHPLSLAANPRAPTWKRHAAVVAHPYAPLGGSYDDPVVGAVAATLLRKGFLIATFNFRGAGNSAGRTSWTARAEREDYATVAGFMVHYIHYLDPFNQPTDPSPYQSLEVPDSKPVPPDAKPSTEPYHPVLLLGGYSYGAMVTATLPPLDSILQPFVAPDPDSDAYQVRLRAQHLAEQQNLVLGSARAAMVERGAARSSSKRGVRIGGDEGGSPRKSHDSHHRRSFSLDAEDKIRRSMGEFIVKASRGRHGQRLLQSDLKSPLEPETPTDATMTKIKDLVIPRPAYLLISPLQGLANHLVTCSLIPSALSRAKQQPEDTAAEEKLVRHPTLAIYGDNDVFVSAAKLKAWTERLEGRQMSMFKGEEIATAGHFWIEEGVMDRMTYLVGEFGETLIG